MIHSFTGPSRLGPSQAAQAARELLDIDPSGTWRSGGALGLDTLVALMAARLNITLDLIVPAEQFWCESLRRLDGVRRIVEVPGSYRSRNQALVNGADILHAFLRRPTFYRSGEWMTVNIARQAGVPVDIHVLD